MAVSWAKRVLRSGNHEIMAKKKSAGIVLYRLSHGELEVFLVHPGGPYWARKDEGAWSIPKGVLQEGEEPIQAAMREFAEETGTPVTGELLALHPIRQANGKVIYAWAVDGDFDPATLRSNLFSIEWPPRSGVTQAFPEVDRGGWFSLPVATQKVLAWQRPLLDELQSLVGGHTHVLTDRQTASMKPGAASGQHRG